MDDEAYQNDFVKNSNRWWELWELIMDYVFKIIN